MSEETELEEVAKTPAAEIDVHELEERRADRNFKYWLKQAVTLTFLAVFAISFLSIIYAAIIQEKDLNTTFIGEVFKMMFDFLRIILA